MDKTAFLWFPLLHLYSKVVMVTTSSSLAVLEIVIITAFGVTSGVSVENMDNIDGWLFYVYYTIHVSQWVQIVRYVLPCRSYSLVCTVHHLIIIIVQTYLKTLNLINSCQIYFVECVSKIRHILSVIHYTIRGAVCFQFTHFPCDDWENIYIYFVLLSSSNRKYELLPIVQG